MNFDDDNYDGDDDGNNADEILVGMVKFDRHYIFDQNEDRDDKNQPQYQAPVDLLLGCSELAARSREGNTGKTAFM